MKVEASLKYGTSLSKKLIVLYYISLLLSLTIALICAIPLIIFSDRLLKESDIIVCFIIVFSFDLILFLFSFWVILHDKKIKKKISLCLEDGIETIAFVRNANENYITYKKNQVEASFFINSKQYVRYSNLGNPILGYSKFFLKYVGKMVMIIYSPKYDDVLFLKQ